MKNCKHIDSFAPCPTALGECSSGHFGSNCSEMCHCQQEECNHVTGSCHHVGCQAGWSGQACDHLQSETSSESSPGSSALIGGGVAAVVAVLIVILIVVVVARKRRTPRKERSLGDNNISSDIHQDKKAGENVYANIATKDTRKTKSFEVKTQKVIETDIDEDEVVYVNGPNDADVRGETKLVVSDLKETVSTKHQNDMFGVEYKSLPHGLKHPHTNAKLEQNLLRNRFKTTCPYDHSRVVLKKEKKGSTDYINANYIDGVRNQKIYIATQGPKTMTLEEFWRMVWQNNCGKIVMLANLVELGKVKCTTYWTGSDGNPLELSLFQVTLQEEVAYAFYTIRKLAVKNKQTKSTREISQYHFTRWPDHGVPEPFELLQFYKRVRSGRTNHKGPFIVHCSAGIGRTGSFIGLDALLLEGNTSGEIDVFAYTEKMRKDRMNMIQTAEQYAMLHDVLLEGLTIVTSSMSKTYFSRVTNDMDDDDIPKQQYLLLNSARPEYSTIEYKTALQNKQKNRDQSILAVEKYKIRLMTTASGYINAVNIPGYRIPYGYILTQHPLDNTVIDFLSLIAQERSDTVVSIGLLQNDPCWPTQQGARAKFGDFVVTSVHCDHHSVGPERVEERHLAIVNKETGTDTKISLLETPSWGSSLPSSSFMLELIQIIQSRRKIDASPVIITCSNGATESGVLCGLCNVMERLEVDGDVDIMAAARQLQIRRPQCFPNKDQYVFCYTLVKEHLEASTVYANV
ncbi:receptor-type tyrosine-protein phosphatase mu-like [Mizuhopecten yessoensis]|uniref:receptor-type tyrosine-protein phosphatase mu-like n=1 Tax=Mizuhopecten yessoensis TaxID=6573 RepID=UPI000B4577B2|nr:receptor-type tyrosine-protein phosphatase mu-like [Mizuhopecten yessoensis]